MTVQLPERRILPRETHGPNGDCNHPLTRFRHRHIQPGAPVTTRPARLLAAALALAPCQLLGQATASGATLSPGQQLVAHDKWPIVGERAPLEPAGAWQIEIAGEVASPHNFDLPALAGLPRTEVVIDIHCVTRWSRPDVSFAGVLLADLLALANPNTAARYVSFVAHSGRAHSTSLPLDDALALLLRRAQTEESGFPQSSFSRSRSRRSRSRSGWDRLAMRHRLRRTRHRRCERRAGTARWPVQGLAQACLASIAEAEEDPVDPPRRRIPTRIHLRCARAGLQPADGVSDAARPPIPLGGSRDIAEDAQRRAMRAHGVAHLTGPIEQALDLALVDRDAGDLLLDLVGDVGECREQAHVRGQLGEHVAELLDPLEVVPQRVREVLAGDDYADAVRADVQEGLELGARGVPFTVFDQRMAVSGAQSVDSYARALNEAVGAATESVSS